MAVLYVARTKAAAAEDDVERTAMDSSAEAFSERYDELVNEIAQDCYATLVYEEICMLRMRSRPVLYHLTLGKIIRNNYSSRFDEEGIPYQRDRMSMDVLHAMVPLVHPEYEDFPLCYPLFDYESFCDLVAYYHLGQHSRHFECIAENYHFLEDSRRISDENPYDQEDEPELWSEYEDKAEQGIVSFMTAMAQDMWDFPAVKQRCKKYGIEESTVDDYEQHCISTMLDGQWHGGRVLPSRMVCFHAKTPLRGDDLDSFIGPLLWFLTNSPGNDAVLRDQLFTDHDICLLLATHAGRLLHRMPLFQDDYSVVAAAVAEYPDAISYASPRLQEDREILALAARNARKTLIFRNPVMKKHRDESPLVTMSVAANGANIAYASKRLRSYKPLAELALYNLTDFAPYEAYESLSDELRADKDIALITIRSGHVDVGAFPESLRDDDDIAALLADSAENRWQLAHMSERIREKFGSGE